MLRFTEQPATISSVNVRAEKHGEDPVPACDVGITFECGAKVLDSLGKGLREVLYANEDGRQARVPGSGDAEDGPKRRFPNLRPLGFDMEWPGYKVGIVWGDLASSITLDLSDVTVKKIKAEPKDGGTVAVSLQMQCHPKKEIYGDLAQLNQREIKLALAPPSASEMKKLQKEAAEKAKGAGGGEPNPEE